MEIKFKRKEEQPIKYTNEYIVALDALKTMFLEDVVFENCIIERMHFKEVKSKKSITFKRCKFISLFSFKNIQADSNINFIECESQTPINLFQLETSNEIYFEHFKSNNTLEFSDIKTHKLHLSNSSFDSLKFISVLQNEINHCFMDNLDISNKVFLSKISKIKTFDISSIKSNEFKLSNCSFENNAKIIIKSSNFNFLQLLFLSSSDKANMNLIDNIVNIIQVNKINLKNTILKIDGGFYSNFIIKKELTDNFIIDFSEAPIENLDISEYLYRFIDNKLDENNHFFIKEDYFQNANILKMFSNMFAENYQYNLQDLCFYHHKNLEFKDKIKNSESFMSKINFYFKYIFGKHFFGWGVKLNDILLSMFYIITIFALIFSVFNLFQDMSFKLKYLVFSNNVCNNYLVSFLSMFGSYSDIEFTTKNKILEFLLYVENLIGILMLTILTGAIIRKLVR